MIRISVKAVSILAVALAAVFSAAACSTGASPDQVNSTTAGPPVTPPYDSYVDDAHIVADYAKTDPGIFEKFNTYPNKTTGEPRKFFDSNGQPDMYVIDHNMETFDEAKFALLPHDFYMQESRHFYDVHESSVAVKPTA
ncbi:hypothetical protein [Nocardia sp. NPDC006630]|uniref:hypothetical protein n=1 Tax=Nocardia sp. NPDC006630 TaxID=3157181 RepID=UPI0033B54BEC